MKNSRLLTIILTLTFIVTIGCLMVFGVSAESTIEAKWGADENNLNSEGTFAEAMTAATQGQAPYIRVEADYLFLENIVGNITTDVTVDLNGANVHIGDLESNIKVENASLILINGSDTEAILSSVPNIKLKNNGKLTAEGNIFIMCTVYVYSDTAVLDISGLDCYHESSINIFNDSIGDINVSDVTVLKDNYSSVYIDYQNDGAIEPVSVLEKGHLCTVGKLITYILDYNNGSGKTVERSFIANESFNFPTLNDISHPDGHGLRGWVTLDGEEYGYEDVVSISEDTTFYAKWGAPISIDERDLKDGEYLSNDGKITNTAPKGGYAYYKDGVLTLNNFKWIIDKEHFNTDDSLLTLYRDIKMVLKGENELSYDNLYSGDYKNVIGNPGDISELTVEGDGSLTMRNGYYGFNVGSVIFNGGSINVQSLDDCIITDSLTINGGNFRLVSMEDEAFDVTDDVVINDGVIYAYAHDNGAEIGGDLYINGGSIDLKADDYGFDVSSEIIITDGYVRILTSDNCLDANTIDISGGTLNLMSSSGWAIDTEFIDISGGQFLLDGRDYVIDAITLNISGENTAIYAYKGVNVIELNVDESVEKLSDDIDVLVLEGTGVTHSWSEDLIYNTYNNNIVWHDCTDEDCILPGDGVFQRYLVDKGSGYCAHRDITGDQICDNCDADLTAEVRYSNVLIDGRPILDGEYMSNEGVISKTAPEGGYAFYDGAVLTLNNFKLRSDKDEAIYAKGELEICLMGENEISTFTTGSSGIYLENGYFEISGGGSLTIYSVNGITVESSAADIIGGDIRIISSYMGVVCYYSDFNLLGGNIDIATYDFGMYIIGGLRIESEVKIDSALYGIYAEYLPIGSKADIEVFAAGMAIHGVAVEFEEEVIIGGGAYYDGDNNQFIEKATGLNARYITIYSFDTLISDINAKIEELDNAVSSNADLSEINEAIENLNDELLLLTNAEGEGKIDLLEKGLESVESAITLINTRLTEVDANKSSINDIKATLDSVRDTLDGLDTEDTRLSGLITGLDTELDTLTASIDGVSDRLDDAEAKLDEVENDVSKALTDLENAKTALDKAIKDGDKALEDKIAELNTALENAKKALADANGTLKTELEDKIDDANEALDDAIGEIKGQLDAVKKDLEEKNKSLEAKNKDLEEKNNELTRKVDSLNTTVIIVAVVSGIGVCGTLGVGIWFFIDKKRSLFK